MRLVCAAARFAGALLLVAGLSVTARQAVARTGGTLPEPFPAGAGSSRGDLPSHAGTHGFSASAARTQAYLGAMYAAALPIRQGTS